MAKVYASLIRKGLLTLDSIKNAEMREEVKRILEEE